MSALLSKADIRSAMAFDGMTFVSLRVAMKAHLRNQRDRNLRTEKSVRVIRLWGFQLKP
jgi:hypothetical protein